MSASAFRACLVLIAGAFTLMFCAIVVPALVQNPDVIAAFAGGFVNPFASGYSLDVICCWCVLAAWVWFEAKQDGVRHGWVALLLGVVPGVAVGFAFYLFIRLRPAQPLQR